MISDDEEIVEVEYAAEHLTSFELFQQMTQGEYSHLLHSMKRSGEAITSPR
jgi:thymidine phosphorylase